MDSYFISVYQKILKILIKVQHYEKVIVTRMKQVYHVKTLSVYRDKRCLITTSFVVVYDLFQKECA